MTAQDFVEDTTDLYGVAKAINQMFLSETLCANIEFENNKPEAIGCTQGSTLGGFHCNRTN